jgi:D-serine dehydratase
MNLTEIAARPLDATSKGIPGPVTPGTARAKGWKLLRPDLPFPVMVLRDSAVEHNLRAMSAWCAKYGFLLAPHGKTSMCPQLYARSLAAGAWAISVATSQQAAVALRFGVGRVLIANQLVGRANIALVAEALNRDPKAEISCLVDSTDGVEHLAGQLREAGARRPLRVLVEIGRAGWRTGARTPEEAREVLAAVRRHAGTLELAGFEGYEGIARLPEAGQAKEFLEFLVRTADQLAGELPKPAEPWIFSAGGTSFLDYQAEVLSPLRARYRTVVRSGCHVSHDHGGYVEHRKRAVARGKGDAWPEFRQALELWSVVQSVRDGSTAILTFGRRDCPHDAEFPVPLFAVRPGQTRKDARPLEGAKVGRLNDQHAFMSLPPGVEVRVGDLVACGICHPCTAFDKWPVIPLVDDADTVTDLYCTYF